MRNVKSLFAGALFVATSALAFGQVTFNLAGPMQHFDLAFDANNPVLSGVATTSSTFVLGNTFSVSSGTVEVLVPGSFGNQNRFRLRNSAHPGAFADLQVFGNGIDFGEGPVSGVFNSTQRLSGTLVGKTIPAGSTWSVEAFESVDNLVDSPDSESSDVVFTINGASAATPPTFIDLGSLADGATGSTTLSYAAGQIRWFKINIPDAITLASLKYLDLDTEGTPQIDTEIAVYSESGFLLANDDDSGSSTFSQLTFGPGAAARNPIGNGLAYEGRHGELAPGDYYIAVGRFNVTFNLTNFSVTTTATQPANITLRWRKNIGSPATVPTFVDLGTLPDSGFVPRTSTHGASQVRWYKFTLAENIDLASGKFLDIDTETTTGFTDTEIGLFNSNGNLVAIDDNDGSSSLSQLSFGPGGFTRTSVGSSVSYNGRDGSLPAGVYYLAVGGQNVAFNNNWVAAGNSTVSGNIITRIRKGVGVPPPPPSNFTDLGTLGNPSTTTQIAAITPGDIKWYRFNLPVATDATSGNYLDIDTLGTASLISPDAGQLPNDTEIALFGPTGLLIRQDDSGGTNGGSLLTFGSGAGDRGDQGTGSTFNYDGTSAQLAAGTYWLAVGGYNANFESGFIASTDSLHAGGLVVNFRLNTPIVASTLSGTVTLQDFAGDLLSKTVEVLVFDGTTQVGGGVTTLDVLGFYEVALFNVPDGTYDVYIKGDTYLRKLTTGVTLAGGAATVDATLINGDVNGDNEVGAADFSQLAAAYDAVEDDPNFDYAADLNGDLEVGAADFSILAASYDAVGDALP